MKPPTLRQAMMMLTTGWSVLGSLLIATGSADICQSHQPAQLLRAAQVDLLQRLTNQTDADLRRCQEGVQKTRHISLLDGLVNDQPAVLATAMPTMLLPAPPVP